MMVTMTLVEFLLARIAEDEAEIGTLAAGVHDDSAGPNGIGWGDVGAISDVLTVSHRRAKAECEAKRQITAMHSLDEDRSTGLCLEDGFTHPCETVRLLTLPYASHPDYREEWRP